MRNLLVVLSAAVLAGLAVYFTFNAFDAFRLVNGDVRADVNVFVLFVASLSLVAAGTTLLLRAILVRTDQATTAALEQRIAQLEQSKPPTP